MLAFVHTTAPPLHESFLKKTVPPVIAILIDHGASPLPTTALGADVLPCTSLHTEKKSD